MYLVHCLGIGVGESLIRISRKLELPRLARSLPLIDVSQYWSNTMCTSLQLLYYRGATILVQYFKVSSPKEVVPADVIIRTMTVPSIMCTVLSAECTRQVT